MKLWAPSWDRCRRASEVPLSNPCENTANNVTGEPGKEFWGETTEGEAALLPDTAPKDLVGPSPPTPWPTASSSRLPEDVNSVGCGWEENGCEAPPPGTELGSSCSAGCAEWGLPGPSAPGGRAEHGLAQAPGASLTNS